MPLQISQTHPATRAQWSAAAGQCEYATFFHTPQWAELARVAFGSRITPRATTITFDDGTSAVIPACVDAGPLRTGRLRLLSPGGTYGGWLSSDALGPEHARLLAAYILGSGPVAWRENPFDESLAGIELAGSTEDFTQVVDLRGRNAASIAGDADYAHRKAVRKAETSGVRVRVGTSPADWDAHYSAYRESQGRWRSRRLEVGIRYPQRLFRHLAGLDSPHIRLWIAEVEGTLAASVVCFYWNHHAVAWHGAGRSAFFDRRPNNLLFAHVIGDACERGYFWFDFNPCRQLDGVAKFKEHLGASRVRTRLVLRESAVRAAVRKLRKMGRSA